MPLKSLSIKLLCEEATSFSRVESQFPEPSLYGVTDGKAVGTYFEHKFQSYLQTKYKFSRGSSAKGIDFPDLGVDMKVTSTKQPQSSCPFKSARQKIYGLGYALLVFAYDKHDDPQTSTGRLDVLHTIFVEASRTADFQTTSGLVRLVANSANKDDVLAYFADRMLPLDNVEADALAEEVLTNPPEIGYLTISNALQWRLQYSRVIEQAGQVGGILRLS
jgi:hypothetical protein